MVSAQSLNGFSPLLEFLWRCLRLPRKAIQYLLYLYSPQELEDKLQCSPGEVLSELPGVWKNEVPTDLPVLYSGPPPDRYFTAADPEYPPKLLELYDPPLVLYYQGDNGLLDHPGPRIAVVGTRRASDYAKRVTVRLIQGLKPYRPLILSGMAWGIDGVAHQTALDEGMATVGVLGTPLHQQVSPHRQKLFRRMGESALLLTELYPEATMAPWRFPERNRLLAALAEAIVVVEAPIPSGALITAQEGVELGREIFVVPGPLAPHFNAGGHRLIQEGAHLLTDPEQIGQILGYTLTKKSPGELTEKEKNSEQVLDPLDRQIMDALQGGPLHVDKIVAFSQNPAPAVLARLIELCLAGRLLETTAGHFEINM